MQNSIKIWNALDGKLKRIYADVTCQEKDVEITEVTFDSNMKRIIVGDSSGKIQILNYAYGSIMKYLNPHEGAEITNLRQVP